MCGLCGTRHAVGEPHRARNAAGFNGRTGQVKGGWIRAGGGYTRHNFSLGVKKTSIASSKGRSARGANKTVQNDHSLPPTGKPKLMNSKMNANTEKRSKRGRI